MPPLDFHSICSVPYRTILHVYDPLSLAESLEIADFGDPASGKTNGLQTSGCE